MNNNMQILNEKVMAVCPIENVYFQEDGFIGIVYKDPDISTEQQKQAAQQVIDSWPLEEKKLEKLAKIDEEWNQIIAQGWNSNQGFTLGLSANDVALISGVFALAKEAAALSLPLPQIIALDNTAISFTSINEMVQLLLQYGSARAQLSSLFANRRKAVENATSIEEVDGV